uniref:VHS domain-containing protein n=1 Tax=Rhabditophanes sp. KR3021 TaxID=114890 RepID=A0AC35TTE1_9BILA
MTPEGLLCDEFMESQVPVFVSKPKILNAGRSKEPSSMKSKPTTQYPAFIPISFGLSDKSKVGTKTSKMSFREPVNKVDCYQNSMTPNEFLNSTYRTSPAEALKKAFASRSKKTEKRKTVSRWEAEKRSLIGYTVDFNSINQQYRDWNQKFEYDQVEEKAKTINEGLAIMKLLDMCAKVSRLNEVLAPMEFKIDQNYDFTIYSNLAKKLSCGGVKMYLPLVEMCRKANPRYPESISEITNWINKRSNHGFCINIMLGILSDYLLHPDIKNETKIDIYVKIFRNHIKYIDRYWGEYGEKVNCTNESYMQFCSLAYQLLKKTPTNNSSAYQTRDFEYDIIKYLRDARFVTKEFNLRELSENYERSVLDEVTVTNSVLNTRTRFYGSMDVIKGFRDKISKLYEENVEVINGLNKSVIVYAKKKNKRF